MTEAEFLDDLSRLLREGLVEQVEFDGVEPRFLPTKAGLRVMVDEVQGERFVSAPDERGGAPPCGPGNSVRRRDPDKIDGSLVLTTDE